MRKELEFPVCVLAFSVCIIFVLYFLLDEFNDILLNLGTEIVGILVTILLIDSVLHRHEMQEHDKIKNIAVKQLKNPLMQHLLLFSNMFKASVEKLPDKKYRTHRDLFDEVFYTQIIYLDFGKISDNFPPQTWAYRASNEFKKFEHFLENTIDKYLAFLEPETLNTLEELRNSEILPYVIRFPEFVNNYKMFGIKNHCYLMEKYHVHLKEYVELFSQLVDIYNEYYPEDKIELHDSLTAANISPRAGSGRISEKEIQQWPLRCSEQNR